MTGPLHIRGMWGIGDNIHQRAVLRELMKTRTVCLETHNTAMYHDLIDRGLQVKPSGRQPRIKEQSPLGKRERPSRMVNAIRMTYGKDTIKQHGTILAAQFAMCGLPMPPRPDFSLPIPPAWQSAARQLIATWNVGGKPLMVYRPIILNNVWRCDSRCPDPDAYAALFASIRNKFFVVSIADLKLGKEWIVGPEPDVDVRLHNGELDFETMAALFAEADLVFCNAGFSPIMAQAVGTPCIIVYGGHESSKTTNIVGTHLAPSLFIEPDHPCDCHAFNHACDKQISLAPALQHIETFVDRYCMPQPRTLIFGTCYVDTRERMQLLDKWLALNARLNPDCDLLIVDSKSPLDIAPVTSGRTAIFSFPDNIGHLNKKGRDGWGRAFCHGLMTAIEEKYDYVAHIECDSLFRLPVAPIVKLMHRDGTKAASMPVTGMRIPGSETGWVETGLMLFSTKYLHEARFIERYDWPNRKNVPPPERIIRSLLGDDLRMMPWRGVRDDKKELTADAVRNLDWITHCNPQMSDAFVASTIPVTPMIKLNFGCGSNRLPGWQNFDAEINIAKPLPFPNAHADFVFAEHCVEHIDYYAALAFFKECARVLKPGGIIRIAVPSIERIRQHGDEEYFAFVRKWAPSNDVRGALDAIIYKHGHKAAWTASLLETSLFYAGFNNIVACEPSQSAHHELVGVEGHSKIIGERINWIETAIAEGTHE